MNKKIEFMNIHKDTYTRELLLAKDAAKKAGDFLTENKKKLNTSLFSSKKDIKLKADISAENLIKDIRWKIKIVFLMIFDAYKKI